MTKKILLATRNAGKIRELAHALAQYDFDVVGLHAFAHVEDIDETGTTFEENALLKARHAALHSGLVAVADDSGLEVDALHGAPGVYSARYANELVLLDGETPDQRNMRKLMHALEHTPEHMRSGRFVCCMAACAPDGTHTLVRGTWEGRILSHMRGENGFGYDPLFFDTQSNKTAAEMTRQEKLGRSHRGVALRMLVAAWNEFYASIGKNR